LIVHCYDTGVTGIWDLILACRDIANELGTIIGGSLFTYVYHNQYFPLILVGLVMPALSVFGASYGAICNRFSAFPCMTALKSAANNHETGNR
jgi:hypothetical protein